MNFKRLTWLAIIILFIPALTLVNTGTSSATTTIYVDPSASTATPGQEFSVEIKVANVMYLYTWELLLEWDHNLLNATNFIEGPFLKTVGKTFLTKRIDNNLGTIRAACTLAGVGPFDAPSGSGTLATVTFRVKMEGGCPLHLSKNENETRLIKFTDTEPILIPRIVEDGYFAYPLPKLYVEPSSIIDPTLGPGSNFTININVAEVTKLYAWEFLLYWDPNLLNATSVTEGPFLNQSGTYTTLFLPPEINQTEGYIHANCTLVEPVPGANGSGTIASIAFLVEALGYTRLDLYETKLIDSKNASIFHAWENGYFNNKVHDIAVTKIEASPTTVKAGDSVTINVTVKNEGNVAETSIDVSVTTPSPPSPSYILIGTQRISSLDPNQETTLTFSWNTKGATSGEYKIRAQATNVTEEMDTADNIRDMDGTVKVTSPEQLPTTLIIGAIIAVAVIGMAIFLYIRRKRPKP